MNSRKSLLFLGSSSQSRGIVECVVHQLDQQPNIECLPWYTAFDKSGATIDQLIGLAKECDFAAFVLAADDKAESGGISKLITRDNVLIEAGIFMAALEIARVFLFKQKTANISSDFLGLNYFSYESADDSEGIDRLINTAKDEIARLGPKPPYASIFNRVDMSPVLVFEADRRSLLAHEVPQLRIVHASASTQPIFNKPAPDLHGKTLEELREIIRSLMKEKASDKHLKRFERDQDAVAAKLSRNDFIHAKVPFVGNDGKRYLPYVVSYGDMNSEHRMRLMVLYLNLEHIPES